RRAFASEPGDDARILERENVGHDIIDSYHRGQFYAAYRDAKAEVQVPHRLDRRLPHIANTASYDTIPRDSFAVVHHHEIDVIIREPGVADRPHHALPVVVQARPAAVAGAPGREREAETQLWMPFLGGLDAPHQRSDDLRRLTALDVEVEPDQAGRCVVRDEGLHARVRCAGEHAGFAARGNDVVDSRLSKIP